MTSCFFGGYSVTLSISSSGNNLSNEFRTWRYLIFERLRLRRVGVDKQLFVIPKFPSPGIQDATSPQRKHGKPIFQKMFFRGVLVKVGGAGNTYINTVKRQRGTNYKTLNKCASGGGCKSGSMTNTMFAGNSNQQTWKTIYKKIIVRLIDTFRGWSCNWRVLTRWEHKTGWMSDVIKLVWEGFGRRSLVMGYPKLIFIQFSLSRFKHVLIGNERG